MGVDKRIREAEKLLGLTNDSIEDDEILVQKEEASKTEISENLESILNHSLYGIHMKKKNNALSEDNPHICIGWSALGDITDIETKDELNELFDETWPDSKARTKGQNVAQVFRFSKEMRIGDWVINGDGSELNIGIITSNYYYEKPDVSLQDEDYVQNRQVKWIFKKISRKGLSRSFSNSINSAMSVFRLNDYKQELYDYLVKITKTKPQPYNKKKFLEDVFIDDEKKYDELKQLLLFKKNIILQGSPGVGKTFMAKRLAYSIIGEQNDEYVEMVQFHQNYSYEDFIMGYKPCDENGFKMEKGIFYSFCKKAKEDLNPEHKYFFIIDEINRGNISKIFGELLMLIESDKRGINNKVKLAYKDNGIFEDFYVPENVYIIGMMNTADRSLAIMDYALRRRFSFYTVEPKFNSKAFKKYLLDNDVCGEILADKIINTFTKLNTVISEDEDLGEGFCIGHSYFCKSGDYKDKAEWYQTILEYEIKPIIKEYCWDKEKDELEQYLSIIN